MDVDNGPNEGSGGGLDIEQSLLQQFSCMGTNDKEELVKELQKVLGSHLNYTTAAFFLDMNNWNLQAAICSYFDVENPMKLPSMALASDPRASECESIDPCTCFQKSWKVFNNGTESWPAGCYLQCAGGEKLGAGRVVVPCLQPGEGTTILLEMCSPEQPGTYQSKWRLCTPGGSYFGDPMWSIITVVEEGAVVLTQQLSHFNELGTFPGTTVPVNPFNQHRMATEHMQNGPPTDSDSHMC